MVFGFIRIQFMKKETDAEMIWVNSKKQITNNLKRSENYNNCSPGIRGAFDSGSTRIKKPPKYIFTSFLDICQNYQGLNEVFLTQ